jgi:hypothetical protein
MGPALLRFLGDPDLVRDVGSTYREIHAKLRRNAGREAAAAVLELVAGGGS